jgi:hypothetical protein
VRFFYTDESGKIPIGGHGKTAVIAGFSVDDSNWRQLNRQGIKAMQKKLAICFGVVSLVLVVTVIAVWDMPPAEPPLRVGMTEAESYRVMTESGREFCNAYHKELTLPENHFGIVKCERYYGNVDPMGHRDGVDVYFNTDMHVILWKVEPLPRTRPPWLDQALNLVGW